MLIMFTATAAARSRRSIRVLRTEDRQVLSQRHIEIEQINTSTATYHINFFLQIIFWYFLLLGLRSTFGGGCGLCHRWLLMFLTFSHLRLLALVFLGFSGERWLTARISSIDYHTIFRKNRDWINDGELVVLHSDTQTVGLCQASEDKVTLKNFSRQSPSCNHRIPFFQPSRSLRCLYYYYKWQFM